MLFYLNKHNDMNPEELSKLSNEQLLKEHQKLKSNSKTTAVIIGVFVGIAIYSAVRNGFGFFTFFPLFFAYILFKKNNIKDIENEMQSRNLK
jgi:hypothetical protein